jgi:hypothetical protein
LTPVASDDDACNSPNAAGSRLTFNAVAGTTYRIATRGFLGSEGTFTLRVTDRAPPRVNSTNPADNATGVARGANVTATFSEAMQSGTIGTGTFKLRRAGTSTNLSAVVTYDAVARRATLNPSANLVSGTTYVATVTSGAQDLAGNALDQDRTTAGDQIKTWNFKVAP